MALFPFFSYPTAQGIQGVRYRSEVLFVLGMAAEKLVFLHLQAHHLHGSSSVEGGANTGMSFRPSWFCSILIAKYRQFQGRSLISPWLPRTPGAVEQHLCSAHGLAPRLGNVCVGFFVVVHYMVMLVLPFYNFH